jgi:glycosyltransferase involved in cell wall biosynthesis
MAKILALADGGVHSGFGTVSHAILDRLVTEHGHDVHLLATNWRGDYWPTPVKMYLPTQKVASDIYGQSRFIEMLGSLMPDAIFILNDPAVVVNMLLASPWDTDKVLWRGITNGEVEYKPPIIGYLPIDGQNTPRSWDILKERVTRVAMSHFGQTAMPEAPVVWHGVDQSVFYPRDKKEAKAALGFDPDRFLILRVDKNSFRKDYPDSYRALRPILRKFSDIDVHFHCQPQAYDGYNLNAMLWNDEDIRDRITFSPNLTGFTGWGTEQLSLLYSAADIFLSTSWSEGFGLTLLEAAACGTSIIAQNVASIPEVVGPGGILIEPDRVVTVPQGQEQWLPDVPAFTAAIERLYLSGGVRRKLGNAAAAHALNFSWDIAAEKMAKIIDGAINPG